MWITFLWHKTVKAPTMYNWCMLP